MLKIELIESIVLSLFGLMLAVRLGKKKELYVRLTTIVFVILEIYGIVILLSGREGIGPIERIIKTYAVDIGFIVFLVIAFILNECKNEIIRKTACIVLRVFGGALCAVCFAYLVYSVASIDACFDKIADSEENLYVIRSAVDEDMVITANIQEGAQGSHLYYEEYTGCSNQKVRLDDMGDGMYKLVLLEAEQAFDLSGGNMAEGTIVDAWEVYDTTTQLWRLERESENTSIISVHSGMAIGRNEGVPDDNILVYNVNDSINQKFVFEKTSSDEKLTRLAAEYNDAKFIGISIYYIYIVIYIAALAGLTVFFLRDRKKQNE